MIGHRKTRRMTMTIWIAVLVASLAACTAAQPATPTPDAASPLPAPSTIEATLATSDATDTATTVVATATPGQTLTTAPTATPTGLTETPPADAGTPTAVATAPTAGATTLTPTTSIGLQLVAEGMTAPVDLVPSPDGTGRLFVVDQAGQIRIITADGNLLPQPFLDLTDRMVTLTASYDERGLLGLAFHPDFAHNKRFFVYYSAPLREGGPAGWNNTIHLSEFQVSADDPNRADPGSEKILLQIDEPQANHEGGTLAFGPDGFLYAGTGDGGGANDSGVGHASQGNGQDTSVLLGKILRIDVNSGEPYGIPPGNPFANGGGAGEIYAYGFRNPYRFSFDVGGNHDLIVADVGQNLFEELDVVTAGGNYGWRLKEGAHCFSPDDPSIPPATCSDTGAGGQPLIDPVVEQAHSQGIAIIGGYVYRGQAVPGLAGAYLFGEWSMQFNAPGGRIYVATPSGSAGASWPVQELAVSGTSDGKLGHFLLGIGQDGVGELYLLTSDTSGPQGNTGRVYKVIP